MGFLSNKFSILLSNWRIILNIINTIIGVGIITLPESTKQGGLFFMLVFSLLCVYLIYFTSILMAKTSTMEENIRTYGELCKASYNEGFRCYLCFITFMQMFGFIAVYCITLRITAQNLISDITLETFKYGRYVLIGFSVIMGFFSLLKNLSMLSYGSFVSTFCVLYMVLVSCVRSPFYHNQMSKLTRQTIVSREKNLNIDRAFWVCNVDKRAFELNDWPSLNIQNYAVLEDFARKEGACGNLKISWPVVSEAIAKIQALPIYGNNVPGISGWLESIEYEHARYLFNQYSLNDFGRKQRRFSLFSVANAEFYLTLGTIASAFIYQQASIENFQSMKKVELQPYRVLLIFSFTFVFICCMIITLSGYFGQEYQVGQYIFTKMKMRYFQSDSYDYMVISGRVALVISIILTYPMQFYFGRINLMIIVVVVKNKILGSEDDPQKPSNLIFYISTVIMFASSLLIGLFSDDASQIFSLIGSMFAGQSIYIIPVICWYGLKGGYFTYMREVISERKYSNIFSQVIFPNIVLVFGIATTLCSTVVSIIKFARES